VTARVFARRSAFRATPRNLHVYENVRFMTRIRRWDDGTHFLDSNVFHTSA
jgi:hypothetical protein